MTMTLQAEQLCVRLQGRPILQGINAAFASHTLAVIIGPNGAGKSTLLRALCGLEAAAAGRIMVPGHGDLKALTPLARARLIAWVPEHSEMPFAFSAQASVVMGRFPWHQGRPTPADAAAAMAALKQLGIGHLAARPVQGLSSGERQKVMIARALASAAPIVLLDEPLANLDIGAALRLLLLLRDLTRSGRTLVVTMHDLALAHRFADHGLCLDGGRVVAGGPDEAPRAAFAKATLDRVFQVQTSWVTTSTAETAPFFVV